jgi:hypothetical protein
MYDNALMSLAMAGMAALPLYDAAQIWLGAAVMATLPLYVVAQIWFVRTWRRGWRIAALAPLIVALPAFAWAV